MDSQSKPAVHFNSKFPLAFYENLADANDKVSSAPADRQIQRETNPVLTSSTKSINDLFVEEQEKLNETFKLSSRSFKKTVYNLSFNDFLNTYGIDPKDVAANEKKYRRLKTFTNDLLKNELSYLPKRRGFQRPKSPYTNTKATENRVDENDFNPYRMYKN
jgi:hypothetical protein